MLQMDSLRGLDGGLGSFSLHHAVNIAQSFAQCLGQLNGKAKVCDYRIIQRLGKSVKVGRQRPKGAKVSTLAEILDGHPADSDAVLVPGGARAGYGDLKDEVERAAELLAGAGVERGRAVSIVLPNGLDFLVAFLAVARAGAIAAPLNSAYTMDEFTFFMEDAEAQLAILPPGDHAGRDAADGLGIPTLDASLDADGKTQLSRGGQTLTRRVDVAGPSPDDVALFLHTSGTTSRPKGVPLTHTNLVTSLANIGDTYALTPDDTALVVMPLFHVHGLIGVALSTLRTGGSIVVPDRFSASRFWDQQRSTGATWYSAVPTIHQILLMRADGEDAPRESFRFIRSCSAALAPAVFHDLESRFGAPVLEAYGMTEAAHQMASNPLPPGARAPGTVGQGTGVDIGVMDDDGALLATGDTGEVVIRGAERHARLSQQPDGERGGVHQRLVQNGRSGDTRRRRHSDADGTHQGANQSGRREDFSARSGRGAAGASVGCRSGLLRNAGRALRRGGAGGGSAVGWGVRERNSGRSAASVWRTSRFPIRCTWWTRCRAARRARFSVEAWRGCLGRVRI